ncbi:hypothetical protein QBC37DRAFT_393105 [Rhypophila decipiens]|uniref:Uncharacterized protein n=1 Tax=Rhypophila decipiens TaxID=261697 RepID=A0AAN6XU88_9PEZI|nr:hypothetical protein QBC37DRAFT_393105 [Rhypophila decipiens]
MAKQLNDDLDILMDEEGFDDFQEKMVRVLQSAFTALSENPVASIAEQAARVASGLQDLIPDPKPDELGYFENVWHGLIKIASRIPHTDDQSHMLLVKTFQALRASESPLWKELVTFSGILRDHWVDPTWEWHPEHECLKLDQWLNLNSFVARLHGSGAFTRNSFPLWQLIAGLEDDLAANAKGDCSPAEAADNRVAVACEYLIHTSPAMLEESLMETGDLIVNEEMRRSYAGGVLFSGGPGFSTERWGFWKRRLGELRPTVSTGVALSVDRALRSMKAAATALVEK